MINIAENLAISWAWFPCLYIKRRPFSPVLPISSPVLLRWGEVNEQLCGCLTASWGQPTAISNLLRKSTCRFVSGLTFLFLYFHMCLGVCYLQAGLLRERLWAHVYGHIAWCAHNYVLTITDVSTNLYSPGSTVVWNTY